MARCGRGAEFCWIDDLGLSAHDKPVMWWHLLGNSVSLF